MYSHHTFDSELSRIRSSFAEKNLININRAKGEKKIIFKDLSLKNSCNIKGALSRTGMT